ncbi:MAG: efflux RND transporter periplasmic adaptor subunit [Planctomycetota bacterium]|nr:efflux RND transporter periplasmic adaptor subunit [Planctomycetota bacterium]
MSRPVLAAVLSFILSFILSSILSAMGCGSPDPAAQKTGAAAEGKPAGPPPTLVRILRIEERTVAPRVTVVGTVIPVRDSVIASGAAGIVDAFLVGEGDFVEAGTPLSRLRMVTTDLEILKAKAEMEEHKHKWEELKHSRPEEIAEAEARMHAAAARKLQAERKFKTAEELKRNNVAVGADLTDVVALRDTTAKEYDAAVQLHKLVVAGPREEIVKQAELRFEAQTQQVAYLEAEKLKRTTLAPFAGIVVKEQTEVGQWLSKGDPVITLARLDDVDVMVNVDQWQLANVKLGHEAEVVIGGVTPERWKGTVFSVVPQSDWRKGSRGFPVRVRLKNEMRIAGHKRVPVLSEGMMASVTFLGDAKSMAMVHKDALVRTNRGAFIHVFRPAADPGESRADQPGSTLQFAIEPGISDGEWIQVTPLGQDGDPSDAAKLAVGMFVVTEGGERLRPVQDNVLGKQ